MVKIYQLPKLLILQAIFCLLSPVFCKSQDITDGLIEYYPFIHGTIDESHHSSSAIVNGIGYTRDLHGYIEGSPVLSGNSYFIEFPDSVNLGLPGWTYSVWFKLHALPHELPEGDAFLLTYKQISVGDDVHLFVDDDDNQLKIFFANGYFKVSSGVTIQRDQWYHAVLRYTSASTDLFVNGTIALSSSGRFTALSAYYPLLISCLIDYSTTKGRVFGNIDDIRMYRRLLSNGEIQALYNYEKNFEAPSVSPDTVFIRDTVSTIDTIYSTIRDTVFTTIYKLDTVILGGNCTIYPNPIKANGQLYVQTNERPASVTIYTSSGQFVRREQLTTQSYITLNNLPGGVYFIKVETFSGKCGKKLIITN